MACASAGPILDGAPDIMRQSDKRINTPSQRLGATIYMNAAQEGAERLISV
jgi:hypothetical protein